MLRNSLTSGTGLLELWKRPATSQAFFNRVGKPLDHINLYHREYKPLLQRAGLMDEGFTFHGLRHAFATELLNQRKRPKIIQALLGHSSIVQTMDTYSHLVPGMADDAAERFGGYLFGGE